LDFRIANGDGIVRGNGNFQFSGQAATAAVGDFNHTITAVNSNRVQTIAGEETGRLRPPRLLVRNG